ncbi:FtsX-like permease family protein [Streptomyces sp. NPDC057403]|uniref:FtsX-like permease family protein n=1 Tax=Streptomyces sp. NPDC057403 TaxID=3346119 RepID=UPI0036C12496
MRTDLRLAWLLTRGSNRREWRRVALTALGSALATGIGLVIAVLAPMDGQYHVSVVRMPGTNQVLVGSGLLDEPGTRDGIVVALMLLLVPVLGFLGQCARIGAVHRDRRGAALRLAGATPAQVRRIAALESGLACLAGSAAATVFSVLFLLRVWRDPEALAWAGVSVVAVLVPVAGAAVSALSLRRVVTSPLGWIRRTRPTRGPGRVFRLATGLLSISAVLLAVGTFSGDPFGLPLAGFALGPLTVFGLCLLVGASAVWLVGWSSRWLGGLLAARTRRPAVLIAAGRLYDDPWTAARTHGAVLLVTVVGTAFVGIRQALFAQLHAADRAGQAGLDMSYYTTGTNLTAAAILVGFAVVLSALGVGTAESLATRRRGLAAQTAAGVPRAVLGRALLLETALPLLPGTAVAGVGGMVIGTWYTSLTADGTAVPYAALLVPLVVYGCCLLAASTSLPLLHRSVRPAELRYA